jgi:tRNA(fMet)-specific endonuclease VapC
MGRLGWKGADCLMGDSTAVDALPALLVMPFDSAAASAYGPIREATRERKKNQLDTLIAAHAVSLGVVLVTSNERDFSAYPGLRVDNWLNA